MRRDEEGSVVLPRCARISTILVAAEGQRTERKAPSWIQSASANRCKMVSSAVANLDRKSVV